VADLKVHVHNLKTGDLKSKIQGLMEFSDSDSEGEFALNCPCAMEEVLAIDARGEIDDPDMSEEESVEQKSTAKMFEEMLQFPNSDNEDEAEFQLRTHGFASSVEEAVQLLTKERMQLKAKAGKMLLANKKATPLVSPTAMQTDADQLMSFVLKTDCGIYRKVKTKTRTRAKSE